MVALFHFSCIMVSHARKIFSTCCGKIWPKKIEQVYAIICMYARKGVGPFVIHGFKTMCNYILAFARLCTLVNFQLKAGCGIKLRQDILFKLPLNSWWRINYKRKSFEGGNLKDISSRIKTHRLWQLWYLHITQIRW